jgi:hypothetical protein
MTTTFSRQQVAEEQRFFGDRVERGSARPARKRALSSMLQNAFEAWMTSGRRLRRDRA